MNVRAGGPLNTFIFTASVSEYTGAIFCNHQEPIGRTWILALIHSSLAIEYSLLVVMSRGAHPTLGYVPRPKVAYDGSGLNVIHGGWGEEEP